MLIGRMTDNPEMRTTPSGQSVCSLRIATNRVWNDKQGQKHREAEYHTVVVWARLAEIASQYLKRGDMVYAEGRLQTRSWQDAQGVKKYRTEIVAERIQLGPKGMGGNMGNSTGRQESEQEQPVENPPTIQVDNQAGPPQSSEAGLGGEIPIIEEEGEIDVKDIPF